MGDVDSGPVVSSSLALGSRARHRGSSVWAIRADEVDRLMKYSQQLKKSRHHHHGNDSDDLDSDEVDQGQQGHHENPLLYLARLSRRQLVTFVIFATANFVAGNMYSLQAPFYPKEAEQKGATPSEYGFIFGVFDLTLMIFSPINGSLVGRVNAKLMFCLGLFTAGTCTIFFGFLDFVDDRLAFITLSFLLRIIQAAAHSADTTASFSIIALEFPNSVSTTFATLETFYGLGLMTGPTTGGVLYELGGFALPFLIMGLLVTLTATLARFFLHNNGTVDGTDLVEESASSSSSKFGFIALMKIPSVVLAGFSIAVSASSIGFLAATLEPHLRAEFSLSPISTGLVFIIDGGMYALSVPLWGRICSKWCSSPKFVTLIGCSLTLVGFILIGPAPFMPFDSILWVTCLGLAIHGLGMGASFVAAFLIGLQDAIANGFPDNVATYGLVSGMWLSFLAFGSFIGPSLAGILTDHFGFILGSLYVLATQGIMIVTTLVFIGKEDERATHDPGDAGDPEEVKPLLLTSNKSELSIIDEVSEGDQQGMGINE